MKTYNSNKAFIKYFGGKKNAYFYRRTKTYLKSLQKTYSFDDIAGENIKEHNPNQPQSPDHIYRTWIISGSRSRKTIALLNLVIHQPNIDNIAYGAKY